MEEIKKTEQEIKWNFRVLGMTCTTCSRIVERALKKVPGVIFASVNLATESAFVLAEPGVREDSLEASVKKSGYEIVKDAPADLDEMRYREARRNLIEILVIGIPLSFLMLLHMFFGYHFPWYGPLEIVFGAAAIFWCGRKTIGGAWIALRHGHTNMDSLIALSAAASWLTAIFNIMGFAIPSFGTVGVMIMMLHLTGRYIESHLRDRAAKQVKTLLTLQPREARVMGDNGETIMVPIEAVKPETIMQVNPGERIPLDGVVIEGKSGVDESLLTGESLPVAKSEGSEVTGGALNTYGILTIRTTKVGEDTFLSKMLELVREAQGGKVPLQALADRLTLKFVPAVIGLAGLSAAAWYFFLPAAARADRAARRDDALADEPVDACRSRGLRLYRDARHRLSLCARPRHAARSRGKHRRGLASRTAHPQRGGDTDIEGREFRDPRQDGHYHKGRAEGHKMAGSRSGSALYLHA